MKPQYADDESQRLSELHAPRVLPVMWQKASWQSGVYEDVSGLRVLFSVSRERDGKAWMHVSCSRMDKLPSWKDLIHVKRVFVGPQRKAIQVLPAEDEHVNIHPYCLHLWACLGDDPLPDFRKDGQI